MLWTLRYRSAMYYYSIPVTTEGAIIATSGGRQSHSNGPREGVLPEGSHACQKMVGGIVRVSC